MKPINERMLFMKKKTKKMIGAGLLGAALALVFALFLFNNPKPIYAEVVQEDKVWTVTFNKEMESDSIHRFSVKVLNKYGINLDSIELNVEVHQNTQNNPELEDSYTVLKVENQAAYEPGNHTLIISSSLTDKEGNYLKERMIKEFTIEGESEEKEPSKELRDMTLSEVKDFYGEFKVVKRIDGRIDGGGIVEIDHMEEWFEKFHGPFGEDMAGPQKYIELTKSALETNAQTSYMREYPGYEVISINGVAYKDSEFYSDLFSNPKTTDHLYLDESIPSQPKGEGEFLIDFMIPWNEFATYTDKNIELSKFGVKSEVINDYAHVDVSTLFENTPVEVSGSTVSYNGTTVSLEVGSKVITVDGEKHPLTNPITQNDDGVIMVPIREIIPFLGLELRFDAFNEHVQIANFPLTNNELVWDETWRE